MCVRFRVVTDHMPANAAMINPPHPKLSRDSNTVMSAGVVLSQSVAVLDRLDLSLSLVRRVSFPSNQETPNLLRIYTAFW